MTEKRVLRNCVDGACTDVVAPGTGEVFASAPLSGPEDVDAAMRAAARAFDGWRTTTPKDRPGSTSPDTNAVCGANRSACAHRSR